MKNKIYLLSSFSTDFFVNNRGNLLYKKAGGPALYISSVLNKEKLDFKIPYYIKQKVKIQLTPYGEFGKVITKIKPKFIDLKSCSNSNLIISTVLNEFNLVNFSKKTVKVFLDIQGFVRNGKKHGGKNFWNLNNNSIFCIKGTSEEISYLPKEFINSQKKKMLLITFGSKGSVLYYKNTLVTSSPSKIILFSDTVGAGDTYFAYFISKYLKSNNPKLSLKYATYKTAEFLNNKI